MTSKNQSTTSKINRIINSFERSVCNISQDIRSRRQTKANTEANARTTRKTTQIKNSSSRNIPPTFNNNTSNNNNANNNTSNNGPNNITTSNSGNNGESSNEKNQSNKTSFLATVKKDNNNRVKPVLDNNSTTATSNLYSSSASSSAPPKTSTTTINTIIEQQSSSNRPPTFLTNTLRKEHTIPPHAIEMVRNLRSINNHFDISLASYPTNIGASTSATAPTTNLPQQNSANKGNAKITNSSAVATSNNSTTSDQQQQQTQTKSVKNKLDEFDEEESAFATYQSRRVSRNANNAATTTLQSSANLAKNNNTNHNVIMVNMINNHSNSHSSSTVDRSLPIQPRYDQMTLRSGDKYPIDTNHNAHLYRPSDTTKSQTTMVEQKQQQPNTIQLIESKLDSTNINLDCRSHQNNNDTNNTHKPYLNQSQYAPSQCYGNTAMIHHANVNQQQHQHSARSSDSYQNNFPTITQENRKDSVDQPEFKLSNPLNMHLSANNSNSRSDLTDSIGSDANQIYVNAPPKPRRYQYYPTDIGNSNDWVAQNNTVIAPESTYGCIPVYLPNNVSGLPFQQSINQQNMDPSIVNQMSTNMIPIPHSLEKMRTLSQSNIHPSMQILPSNMIRYDYNSSEGCSTSSPLSLNDRSSNQRKVLQQSSSLASQAAAAARFFQSKDGHFITDRKPGTNILGSPNARAPLMPKENVYNRNNDINQASMNSKFEKNVISTNRASIVSSGVPPSIFSLPKSKSSLEARDVARFASIKRQQLQSVQPQAIMLQPNLSNPDNIDRYQLAKQNPHVLANQPQYIQSDMNRPLYPVPNLNMVPSKSEYNLSAGLINTTINSHLTASPNVQGEFRFNNFVNSQILDHQMMTNAHQSKIVTPNTQTYLQPRNLLHHHKTANLSEVQSINNTLLRSKSVTHLSDQNMRPVQDIKSSILPSHFTTSQLDIHGQSLKNPPVMQNISMHTNSNDGNRRDMFSSEDEEVARIQDKKRVTLSNGLRDNIHAPVMLFSDGHRHRCMTSTDLDFLQRRGFGPDIQRIQGIGNRTLNENADFIKQHLINYQNNSDIIYGSQDRIFATRDIKIENNYNPSSNENIYSCDPNNNNMGNRQHRQYDFINHGNQYDPSRTIINQNSNNFANTQQQIRNPMRYHEPINGLVRDGVHLHNAALHIGSDSQSIVDLTTPRILSTTKTILAPYNDNNWSNEVGLPIADGAEIQIRRSIRSDKTRPLVESSYSSHSLLRNDPKAINFQRAPTPLRDCSSNTSNGCRGRQQDASSQTSSNSIVNSAGKSNSVEISDDKSKVALRRQSVGCNTDIKSSQSHHALGIINKLPSEKSENTLKQNPAYPKFYSDKTSDVPAYPESSEKTDTCDGERPSAPYYYSDLKSEDQQRALLEIQQKKSLSPPPQLLSRSLGQNKINNSTRLMPKSAMVPHSSELADKVKSELQIKTSESAANDPNDVLQSKDCGELNHNNVRSASLASTLTIKSDNGIQPLEYKRGENCVNSPHRLETRPTLSTNPKLTSNITRNIDKLIEGKSISILEEKLKEKNFNNPFLDGSKEDSESVTGNRVDKLKQAINDDIINRSKSLENVGLQDDVTSDLKLPWISSKTISCNLQEYQDHPVYENISRARTDESFTGNKSKKYEHSSSSSRNSLESMIDLSLDTASNSDTMDNTVSLASKSYKNLYLKDEVGKDSGNAENLPISSIDSHLTKLLEQLKNNHSELTENYRKTLSKLAETIHDSDLTKGSLDNYNVNVSLKSLGCEKQCENQLALINMIENMILECKSIQLKDSRNLHDDKSGGSYSNKSHLENFKPTCNVIEVDRTGCTDNVPGSCESQVYENINDANSKVANDDVLSAKANQSPTNSSDTSSVSNVNNSSSLPSSPSLNQDNFMNSNDSGFVALESAKTVPSTVRVDETNSDSGKPSVKCSDNSNDDVSTYENIKCRSSLDSSSNNRFTKYSKTSQPKVKCQTIKDQRDVILDRARAVSRKNSLVHPRPLSLSARHQQSVEHKNKKPCDKQEEKSLEGTKNNHQKTKSPGPMMKGNPQTSQTLSAKSRLLQQHKKAILPNFAQLKVDEAFTSKSENNRCLSSYSRNNKFELERRRKTSFDESALKNSSSDVSSSNASVNKSSRYTMKGKDDTSKSDSSTKRRNFDDNIDMIEFIPHDNGGFSSSQFSASDFDTDASTVTEFDREQFNGSVLGNVVGVDSTIDLHDDIADENDVSIAPSNH